MKNTWNKLLYLVCAILLIAFIILLVRVLQSKNEYQYLMQLTPTPLVWEETVNATLNNTENHSEPVPENAQTLETKMPQPSFSPAPTPLLIKNGSTGADVKAIQEKLIALGYLSGAADGQFGKATQNAVQWFQTQHNITADGIVGSQTYALLLSQQAQQAIATPTPSPTPSANSKDFLILVNKKVVLDESFVPLDLVKADEILTENYIHIKYKNTMANRTALLALQEMLQAAYTDGLDIWQISSAYRSVKDQKNIFNKRVQTYMQENKLNKAKATSATKQTVADPGTSEHHTGLAFDITVPGKLFKDTKQSKWLEKNCYKYGFIIRYTEGKQSITGYLPEPWHIRYVGLPHAEEMYKNNLTLEEYLFKLGMIQEY
ncbi:MAG: D-alanyl-D-alanine carboxypeptidase family protein [Eubacteriales bacterium]|nr:D-alanyl-D-alanine carboxypeptidase family protein [Eubacteriales bacterium]